MTTAAPTASDARATTPESAGQRPAAHALLLTSGFAGLGYQIIWTEQARIWLGHEAPAVLAVVAAFFGGLALGGLALGPRIERSTRPVRWYAGAELVIAVHALLLLAGFAPFGAAMAKLTGLEASPLRQWSLTFLGTFLVLLPATLAMGVTLPALARLTRELDRNGHSLAALYAANTFGGVLGVLGVAFALIPAFGLAHATLACAGLNLGASVLAWRAFPPLVVPAGPRELARGRATELLALLALTGFLGIGYEVVVVRVLSEVTEDTVYTFALLLAVYLVGTALGAAVYHRVLEPRRTRKGTTDRLLSALAASCLVGALALFGAERLRLAVADAFAPGMTGALVAEGTLALAAFALPTVAMGAVWSHLSERALRAGVSLGRALGVNTLGAALAPAIYGAFVLPLLGAKLALLALVVGYLVPVVHKGFAARDGWAVAAGVVGVALLAPPLVFVDVPDDAHIVSHEEGSMAAVSVVEDASGVRRLRINNRQQEGSSASFYVDARQAFLPLLLHAAPRHALFLGLGTGVTASAATLDLTVDVDAVELLPEVIRASSQFVPSVAEASRSRLHVVAADARRFVRASERDYDVIVSDNFHPARSGSGALYTVEHFAAVRQRLATHGVFCQWLPLHQLDLETLRSVVGSFLAVYPHGAALLANNSLETPVLGLVGRREAEPFDAVALARRRNAVSEAAQLDALGLDDEFAVLGSFVAGPRALARFAAGAPLNTDDRPIVAYLAPRVTYAPNSKPSDRVITLLTELSITPSELIAPGGDATFEPRLTAYFHARKRFVSAGRDVRPSADAAHMLAQVEQPLLAVLRESPDFRPAYDPLLTLARSLAHSDVTRARALLVELAKLQPARTEASRALQRLGDEPATLDALSR